MVSSHALLSRDNLGNVWQKDIKIESIARGARPRSPETALDQFFHHARHPGRSCPSLPGYSSPVSAVATILGCQGLSQSCTNTVLNLDILATLISEA